MALFTEEGTRKGTKSSFCTAFNHVNVDEKQQSSSGRHLLYKVVWLRSISFGKMCSRYAQYLKNRYGANITVVFDGYPSDTSEKNTKTLNTPRARPTFLPDVIFDGKKNMSSTYEVVDIASEDINFVGLAMWFVRKK